MMIVSRRTLLAGLAAGLMTFAAWHQPASAQDSGKRTIEVRIENRHVAADMRTIRITEGETVELRWISDEAVELHLHGYDLKAELRPGEPTVMTVEAYAAGRFPITSHGWGDGGHGHDAMTYLEIYPR
jgi:FtsP/CotA-like multicopper oxidase with cupredoxin domain